MSKKNAEVVSVRILPNTTGNPPGKLADAEVIFEAEAGPFNGMKLIGFAVWMADLRVVNRALPTATPEQWAFLRQVEAAVPDADVRLRERCLIWTRDPQAPKLRHVTVLAVKKVGLITLRRELWVPEDVARADVSSREDPMTA